MGIKKIPWLYIYINFFFRATPKPQSISGSRLLASGEIVYLLGEP